MAEQSKGKGRQGIDQAVLAMAEPICQSLGCEIVDVEWKKEGSQWFLRVFIDREQGVDLDLCTDVSHAVSDALDANDFIEPNYMLEVSSPGIERPLKKGTDFQRFAGKEALIKLYRPVDGKKQFTGTLLGYTQQGVGLKEGANGKEYYFPLEEISKANLVFQF